MVHLDGVNNWWISHTFCTKSDPQKWIKKYFLLLAGWWGLIQITNGKNFIQKLMWCGYTICLTNWRAKYCTRTRRARHICPPSKKCDTWKQFPSIRFCLHLRYRYLNFGFCKRLNNVNWIGFICSAWISMWICQTLTVYKWVDGICFLFGKLGFQIWKALGEKEICKSRHESSSRCTDK